MCVDKKTPRLLAVSANYENGQVKVSQNYLYGLLKSGVVPLVVSEFPTGGAEQIAKAASGLVLTGGIDVNPSLYGEYRHPATQIDSVRDACEMDLLAAFEKQQKPVLGICRGVQLMNVFAGGTLVQHLPDSPHVRHDHSCSQTRHPVECQPDSFLHFLEGTVQVNSTHHQAVGRLGKGFRAVACSDDGVIEAIQRGNWWGVQWHPERLGDAMDELFRNFVAECLKG